MLAVFKKPVVYRLVQGGTALLCLYLFALSLFLPRSLLVDLGIHGNVASDFLSRRASMFLLGISVLTFQARKATPSPARQSILISIAVVMGGLAMTGLFEFFRGAVTAAIFGPVSVEILLMTSYFLLWIHGRSPSPTFQRSR